METSLGLEQCQPILLRGQQEEENEATKKHETIANYRNHLWTKKILSILCQGSDDAWVDSWQGQSDNRKKKKKQQCTAWWSHVSLDDYPTWVQVLSNMVQQCRPSTTTVPCISTRINTPLQSAMHDTSPAAMPIADTTCFSILQPASRLTRLGWYGGACMCTGVWTCVNVYFFLCESVRDLANLSISTCLPLGRQVLSRCMYSAMPTNKIITFHYEKKCAK